MLRSDYRKQWLLKRLQIKQREKDLEARFQLKGKNEAEKMVELSEKIHGTAK